MEEKPKVGEESPIFPDEDGENPKQDELDDAKFVGDDGMGNASIMKPRKPTRHYRGRDSYYGADGTLYGRFDKSADVDDDDTVVEYRNSKWHILSAVIFVASSILYVAMASMVMDAYWFYKDVPRHVYFADDDAAWWNYFINCTEDGHIPSNVTMADDDYTWVDWYNNTAFFEDDYFWQPKIANANAPFPESYVSKYMMIYFFAASGFLVTGAIEVVLARKAKFIYRMLYYLMMLAAAFGVVSACLTNKNPLWSNITNCISVNLWALEAIMIVCQRLQGTSEVDDYEEYARIYGISVTAWFYLADFSFLIGTVGDAVTSYFYVFEYDNWKLGISAVVFAVFWLICSLVYLLVAIHDYGEFKKYYLSLAQEEKMAMENAITDKIVVMEVGNAGIDKTPPVQEESNDQISANTDIASPAPSAPPSSSNGGDNEPVQ